MKRLFITLTLVAAALAAMAGPKVSWLATTHNFGAFNEELGAVTATFRCVNTGDEPLVITGARANCGCTTPTYTREAIAPGDTATITVRYDAGGRPGRFSKKIYIDTNTDPVRSTLTISGVVIGAEASISQRYPVTAGPLSLTRPAVLMGNVAKGHVKSVFLNAYNRSTDTLTLVVTDLPKWLEVTSSPAVAPPGEQVALNFFARADRTPLYGVVTDTVTLHAGDAPDAPVTRIPVIVTITEDFSSLTDKELANSPIATLGAERIELGTIAPGLPATTEVALRNTGKRPLEVRRVYSTDPGVDVAVKQTRVKPGKETVITITVTPAPGTELVNERIIVITNDPLSPVQTIRIAAQVQ